MISDSQGKEFKYLEYDPYGEQWISETNNLTSGAVGPDAIEFGFTDHLHDEETGLIYANARYLDPKTSRWMSSDPAMGEYFPEAMLELKEEDRPKVDDDKIPGSDLPARGIYNHLNLQVYHYAGNNPLKYSDPNGAWAVTLAVSGSARAGVSASIGVGIVIAKSDYGKYSIGGYSIVAGGSSVGFGADVSVEIGFNANAQVVEDIEGSSLNTGGSAVVSAGLDINTNIETGEVDGASINFGVGGKLGGEGHARIGHTSVKRFANRFEARFTNTSLVLDDYLVYDSKYDRYVIYESDLKFLDNVSYEIALAEDLIVP